MSLDGDTDVLGRADLVLVENGAELADRGGGMHEYERVGGVGAAPLEERFSFDLIEAENRQGALHAKVVFAPAQISGRVRVVGARVFLRAEHESGTLVAEIAEAIKGVEGVIEGATRDAVEIGANTEAHGDDGVSVELAGKVLGDVRATEAEDALDPTGFENLSKTTNGEAGGLEPEGIEAVAELGGATSHAIVDTRKVGRGFPGAFLGIERDHPEASVSAHGAGFAQVPHHIDHAGVGDVAVLGGELADADLGGG